MDKKMVCDICKKSESTVHLTQIIEGKMLKVDLCEACAKAKGVHEAEGFSLSDLLVGLGSAEEIKTEAAGARCPACGFTQADFKKTGRLGCAVCWETFETGLSSLLKAMHKGERHVGKGPRRMVQTVALSEKIKELTATLDKAIKSEKYEEAAALRDEIRDLESKMKLTGAAVGTLR